MLKGFSEHMVFATQARITDSEPLAHLPVDIAEYLFFFCPLRFLIYSFVRCLFHFDADRLTAQEIPTAMGGSARFHASSERQKAQSAMAGKI